MRDSEAKIAAIVSEHLLMTISSRALQFADTQCALIDLFTLFLKVVHTRVDALAWKERQST